ncbi:MAG: short-chain dehydrogenase [Panacagrimonas sp.]|jgi:short-subunit dehydrogenase|nr:SDR family NAD(P)-dependent oxidoreductase [Panacagrimonas sp.]MCC2656803.1 short-chain dehydrogenase [Panacagrimonas sp.]
MSRNIQRRTVVLTGASSGIGEAAARQLAARGARVCLVARRGDELERVQDAIRADGAECWIYRADLSVVEEAEACADRILAEHEEVDVLVNNAGRSIRRPITASFDRFHDYQRTMQLNYFAAVRLTQKFLPGMLARRRGQIVNVSSLSVQVATPQFAAYVASKSALEGFSRCLAIEMVGKGVAVSVISYPLVRTAMTAPTAIYRYVPMMDVQTAGGWIVRAIEKRSPRVGPTFGDAWGAATMMLPTATTELTGRAFRFIGKRLQRRADRDSDSTD